MLQREDKIACIVVSCFTLILHLSTITALLMSEPVEGQS